MKTGERSSTHSRTLAALAALGLVAACASDEAQPVINSAGAGGAGSDAAGSSGSGGVGAAGGSAVRGAAGSAGNTNVAGNGGSAPELTQDAGSGRDCTPEVTAPAPAGGLLANFSGDDAGVDAGVALGALFAFPPDSPAAPSFEIANGALHITVNIAPTAEPQYPLVLFGFPGCLDASAFSGVSFAIHGSYSGCTMQYGSADVAHQDQTSGAPYATGPRGSYQPQAIIAAAELTAEPRTLLMPFVGGPSGGNPATPIDEAKLISLLWQFSIAAGSSAAPCVADISIDDLTFY